MPSLKSIKIQRVKEKLLKTTDALPIDLFRIAVGALSFCYFIRLLLEAQDFSLSSGLIDHELSFHILWFTKLTLLGSWIDGAPIYALLFLGLLASLAIIIGFQTKPSAFYIFVFTVCLSRRNFLVLSVDDCSIYLLMFWLQVLPVGNTLSLHQYLKSPQSAKSWLTLKVPGAGMRLFLCNISLYYLTVGLSKLISPLWREGLAVYAVLQMPIARSFGLWNEHSFHFLWVLNHLTLVLETSLAVLPFLPAHSRWKWPLLLSAVGLHASIVVLIGVPYVNATMIIAMLLIFRHEIMGYLRKKYTSAPQLELPKNTEDSQECAKKLDCPSKIAIAFLFLLCLVSTKGIPLLDNLYKPAVGMLYLAGIAQDYHLFDWIDRFNYVVVYKVMRKDAQGTAEVSDEDLFPPNIRGKILQSYIYHMRWMPVPTAFEGELRRSLLKRAAARYARRHPKEEGLIEVKALVQRIDHQNLKVDKPQEHHLITFTFANAKANIIGAY